MSSILVINASDPETRVALVENGHISEFYLERNQERGIVGNVYKGKVVRVLPGMQAAFVDIGLDKAAFLYVSDVTYDPSFSERQYDLTEGEHPESESPPDVEAAEGEAAKEARAPKAPNGGEGEVNIQDLLKEGQEILVQVVKDPIGTKGARISCHISIPGRHLVFMPTVDHIGISRRIENDKERRRLREIVEGIRPPGTGFIVRTVAEGVPAEKLQADARFLMHIWDEIQRKKEKPSGPALLHPDLDIVLRATRDLFSADVEKLVIDDREQYERIMRFVKATDPALADHVEYYTGEEPIFDAYGIEHELQRAQQRKVWLKSGGYIVIDQAEALTAIDVNSGRYVGKKSLEETITKINIEAAKEIVYQLRLRNIGGIIIIDFIDMDKGQNRDKVFKALQEALGKDKAKTNVLKISELGLVEMTRKRVRESIGRMMNEPCPYCDGRGTVKSRVTVAYEIFREIRREATAFREPILVVNCHPEVAKVLQGEERENLRHLMDKFNKTIQVRAQQHYHIEQFDFVGRQDRPKPQRPSPQKAAAQEVRAATEEVAKAPAVRNGEIPDAAEAPRPAEPESLGEKAGEPGAT
jgi:ribonuclease G